MIVSQTGYAVFPTNPAEGYKMRFLNIFSANMLLLSGIWNLVQTPQKKLKFHEAKPSEISKFSVVFESQIQNSTLRRSVFVVFDSNTTDIGQIPQILSG